MPTELDFSIVLCTRNRATLLANALESLLAIDYPAQKFELLLVDNGSTDGTRDLAARYAERAPFAVRYVHEPRVGLSVARNRGIGEARGRFLLFTDDDQLVDPAIFSEYSRAIAKSDARVIQGAIELEFTQAPPDWLHGPISTFLGATPAGPEGPIEGDLHGGNMLLRRDLFAGPLAFREDLGKGRVGYCEDTELSRRLRAQGEAMYRAPRAMQRHVIGPDRMSQRFLRRTAFEKGLSHGLLLEAEQSLFPAGRRALSHIRHHSIDIARARWRTDEHARLLSELYALYELGRLFGYARLSGSRFKRGAP